MAQWVDMEPLENKNHTSLTPTCAQCVIFQFPCLLIEPLGGLDRFLCRSVHPYPELPKLKPPPVDDVVVAAGFDPKRPPLDVLFDVPNVKVIV